MKKASLFLVMLLMVMGLAACGGGGASTTPEGTVSGFMDALKGMDMQAMSALCTNDDFDESDLNGMSGDMLSFFADSAAQMTYELGEAQVTEDSATVTVSCHYVDGSTFAQNVLGELMQQVITQTFSGTELTEDQVAELTLQIMNDNKDTLGSEFADAELTFTCRQADGVWKIAVVDGAVTDIMTANMVSAFSGLGGAFAN